MSRYEAIQSIYIHDLADRLNKMHRQGSFVVLHISYVDGEFHALLEMED